MPAKPKTSLLPRQHVAQIAEVAGVHSAFNWFRRHEEDFCRWQMEFAAIPAPPFGESKRAAWLKKKFSDVGLSRVTIDEQGNVIGFRPGKDPAQPLNAVAAHIDTVFPAGTEIKIRREGARLLGPGISDNASGVTALLATAAALDAAKISHQAGFVFIGTVGEEGEGDLRGMRHIFSAAPFRANIAATLVVDGAGTETIVNHALGSRRFEITLRGKGGHSWSDFGEPNPLAILAKVVADFYQTDVPRTGKKKSAYNVGVFQSGTSVNSIPQSATARVDLRSEAQEEIDRLEEALRNAVNAAVSSNGQPKTLACEIKKIGQRPAAELDAGARIVQIARAVDAHLEIRSRLHCSSTDANIPLALGQEAISIGAGGAGGGAHTLEEWYEPAGRDLALQRITLILLALAGVDE